MVLKKRKNEGIEYMMRAISRAFLFVSLMGAVICSATALNFFEIFEEADKQPSLEQVKEAIKQGADVNARHEMGWTPLMIAALSNNNPEIIKALIKAGADINAQDNFGSTPLMFAASRNKNPEVISALLHAGSDVNARKENGWTALMRAARHNENSDVITVLLDAGADPTLKDANGKTAFDLAKENEKIKGSAAYWKLNDARFK